MRLLFPLAFLALVATSSALENVTALDALKLLPKDQRKLVARIEARDGNPVPERWHILVHDQAAENGLKEFVVAGGTLVAARNVSQFAEKVAPEDVIGETSRCDSDRAAKLLTQYAQANGVTIASMNYGLGRSSADVPPLWKVTAFDVDGKELGSLVLTAAKGAIVSHDGFPLDPGASPSDMEAERERYRTSSNLGSRVQPVRRASTPEPPKRSTFLDRLFGSKPPGH